MLKVWKTRGTQSAWPISQTTLSPSHRKEVRMMQSLLQARSCVNASLRTTHQFFQTTRTLRELSTWWTTWTICSVKPTYSLRSTKTAKVKIIIQKQIKWAAFKTIFLRRLWLITQSIQIKTKAIRKKSDKWHGRVALKHSFKPTLKLMIKTQTSRKKSHVRKVIASPAWKVQSHSSRWLKVLRHLRERSMRKLQRKKQLTKATSRQ